MATFQLRMWTGPSLVRELASKIREAGYDAQEGTEHVYGVIAEGWRGDVAFHNFRVDLERKHGTSFGLKLASSQALPESREVCDRCECRGEVVESTCDETLCHECNAGHACDVCDIAD